jgi:hypothetical protein
MASTPYTIGIAGGTESGKTTIAAAQQEKHRRAATMKILLYMAEFYGGCRNANNYSAEANEPALNNACKIKDSPQHDYLVLLIAMQVGLRHETRLQNK